MSLVAVLRPKTRNFLEAEVAPALPLEAFKNRELYTDEQRGTIVGYLRVHEYRYS